MRRIVFVIFALSLLLGLSSMAFAIGALNTNTPSNTQNSKIPERYAMEVSDVFKPYDPGRDWIVTQDEVPYVKKFQVDECDLYGIISCYDRKYFRVDMILNNPVTFQWKVFYQITFEFDKNIYRYYTYYPSSKQLVYEREANGKITDRQVIDVRNSSDYYAGVTTGRGYKNCDVYLIINKDGFLAGTRGETYFLTTTFATGYVDTKDQMQYEVETDAVDLYLKK